MRRKAQDRFRLRRHLAKEKTRNRLRVFLLVRQAATIDRAEYSVG